MSVPVSVLQWAPALLVPVSVPVASVQRSEPESELVFAAAEQRH